MQAPLSVRESAAYGILSRMENGLGARVKQVRDALGLTQEAFADRLGVSRGAVGNWELGQGIKRENLASIARLSAGRVTMDWLVDGRGRGPGDPVSFVDVPLFSWIAAGRLDDPGARIEPDAMLAVPDLGPGDYIAIRVRGESMDRVSPDGSVILVNRAERELLDGRAYVFRINGDLGYKRWDAALQALMPDSVLPHKPTPVGRNGAELNIVGRVRRTMLDL